VLLLLRLFDLEQVLVLKIFYVTKLFYSGVKHAKLFANDSVFDTEKI
jgi:hypothetical protein